MPFAFLPLNQIDDALMWGRADRDALMRVCTEFASHARSCAEDKTEIKNRLDQQDKTSVERHEENVKRLTAIKEQNGKIQMRVLIWAVLTLLGVLGSILASSVHFKISLG